jgi:DNA processing protein
MLDLRAAAALSALPGALGCHLLAACRARRSSLDLVSEVSVLADFDVEAELRTIFPAPDSALRSARARERAHRALDDAAHRAITPVPFGHTAYPPLLARIPDPPPMLWVAGRVDVLSRPTVAIVGSRAAAPLSLEIAFELGRDLAATLVVASGLARGVDAAAHRGALDAGQTVAVLGSGADVIYPSEHRTLADAIAAAGAIVSEVVPGTPPRRDHFPRRNRLISGLALGVVVVEASPRSGSLITARVALDQGREVMAVPGPAAGERNRGAHGLIRDGAALVEQAADVLATLGMAPATETPVSATPLKRRSGAEPLFEHMSPGETYDLPRLIEVSGRTAVDILRRLLDLELAGQVARVPGGRFFRPVNARKDEVVR